MFVGHCASQTATSADRESRFEQDGTALVVVNNPEEWLALLNAIKKLGVAVSYAEPMLEYTAPAERPDLVIYGPMSDPPVPYAEHKTFDEGGRVNIPSELAERIRENPALAIGLFEFGSDADQFVQATIEHGLWQQRHRLRWIQTLTGARRRAAEAELATEQAALDSAAADYLKEMEQERARGTFARFLALIAHMPAELFESIIHSPEHMAAMLGIVAAGGK